MGEIIEQYNNASNLAARISIHKNYSTNKTDWFHWLFSQYQIGQNSRILELGCGNGNFWAKNVHSIPSGWDVTLSDFSEGMLADARKNTQHLPNLKFEQIDIQTIPYESDAFDVIIANHMLYHVPDRPRALHEVRRVLKPGGVFYSSTIGKRHLIEFNDLITEFDPAANFSAIFSNAGEFGMENGAAQLLPFFSDVRLVPYPDGLKITEIQPIIDYLLSTNSEINNWLTGEKLSAFTRFLEQKKQRNNGTIDITKATGLFISS